MYEDSAEDDTKQSVEDTGMGLTVRNEGAERI